MCAPIALGVASFAVGAVGAYGQYQSGQAQAAAANQSAASNYKYQLKMRERAWDRDRGVYSLQKHEYGNQVVENNSAAQDAYQSEQRRLNEAYMEASLADQAMQIQLLQSSGKMAAAGRTGKSADRVDSSVVSAYGRNQAILAQSLTSANQAFEYGTEDIRSRLRQSNRQAWSQVAVAPQPGMAPPKPVMQQGPSGTSLLAGLGQSAIGGYTAYNQLKAPPAYINPPTP